MSSVGDCICGQAYGMMKPYCPQHGVAGVYRAAPDVMEPMIEPMVEIPLARAQGMRDEITRLREVNAALLDALRAMVRSHGMHGPCQSNGCTECRRAHDAARATIKNTEE